MKEEAANLNQEKATQRALRLLKLMVEEAATGNRPRLVQRLQELEALIQIIQRSSTIKH